MTFSSIGKQRRLNKLFVGGKTLVVPIDDSLIFGPKEGLLNINDTINEIVSAKPNAILGFKGDIDFLTRNNLEVPFIYNITASTILNAHTRKVMIASVENAITIGADCVAAHINFSSMYENEMLRNFSLIANECDRLGMPLLAIAYPRKERNGQDYNYLDVKEQDSASYTELVSHCVRIVSELGADIIKTNYTGNADSFKHVVASATGKPVIIAGGPKQTVEKSFSIAVGAIEAGAAGISFGRNVFNSDHICAYITVLKDIIYDGYTLSSAVSKYYKLIGEI